VVRGRDEAAAAIDVSRTEITSVVSCVEVWVPLSTCSVSCESNVSASTLTASPGCASDTRRLRARVDHQVGERVHDARGVAHQAHRSLAPGRARDLEMCDASDRHPAGDRLIGGQQRLRKLSVAVSLQETSVGLCLGVAVRGASRPRRSGIALPALGSWPRLKSRPSNEWSATSRPVRDPSRRPVRTANRRAPAGR
jgi:hypothetical protein